MNRHATNLLVEYQNQQIVDLIKSIDFVLENCADPTIESALDSYRQSLANAWHKGMDARLACSRREIKA